MPSRIIWQDKRRGNRDHVHHHPHLLRRLFMRFRVNDLVNRARTLSRTNYFLNFYYGEKFSRHPFDTAIKFLLARLSFVYHIPLLFPNRYFPVTIHGVKFWVRLFHSPVTVDIALGVYEYWLARIFRRYAKPGMTILDIGAHHGYYALLAARLMEDKGKIYAFEPDPLNCNHFLHNIAANKMKSIHVYPLALSDQTSETTFFAADGLGSLQFNPIVRAFNVETERISVHTRTLDQVVRDDNIRRIDLIKIDVEGSELLVLKGARDTLKRMNADILMDVDSRNNYERMELFTFLQDLGYRVYKVGKELTPITTASQLMLKETHKQYRNVRSIYARKNSR